MTKAKKTAERRRSKDRRKSTTMDVIYDRLVTRKILPERRKRDRRKD